MTEADIQQALVRYFDWQRNRCYVNIYVGGWESDFAVVTKAGYLYDVEIKISLADWKAEQHKDKFKPGWVGQNHRKLVSRMFYAVPAELVQRVPEFVPAETGLLSVSPPLDRRYHSKVELVRPAKRLEAKALSEKKQLQLHDSTYWRYWRDVRKAVDISAAETYVVPEEDEVVA
jgi:hypothetical protein